MPKDNENLSLPFAGPMQPSEREGFAFEEMITCNECLRSNPPTRMTCLYCGSTLPETESSARLRKPTLIQPDKLCPGYNTIFIGKSQTRLDPQPLAEAAQLLKLTPETLGKLLSAPVPLPLAHTASEEEANLVTNRMRALGIDSCTMSDKELGIFEGCVVRIRSLRFDETSFSVRFSSSAHEKEIAYDDLILLVQGRLIIKTMEMKERKSRGSENELLSTSELFADQPVVDIYSARDSETWRVAANNFDFSCLLDQKTLVAGENFFKLLGVIKAKAAQVEIDEHYNSLRQFFEPIWGSEKETKSRGWRRDSPGRLIIEAATTDSNETQFTRYSRLRYHTLCKAIG